MWKKNSIPDLYILFSIIKYSIVSKSRIVRRKNTEKYNPLSSFIFLIVANVFQRLKANSIVDFQNSADVNTI